MKKSKYERFQYIVLCVMILMYILALIQIVFEPSWWRLCLGVIYCFLPGVMSFCLGEMRDCRHETNSDEYLTLYLSDGVTYSNDFVNALVNRLDVKGIYIERDRHSGH